MFGMIEERICLPPELLLMITKHLDDTDCMAISLSDVFKGFTSLYYRKRKLNSITVNYKCYFLSQPRTWNTFLCQHTSSPLSVTSFNANNCYWLPTKLLCDALVKMGNLEELSIKETKVSFPELARVLEHCPKITKLDFTFYEKRWEEIRDAVMNEPYSIDSVIQGFKKLTSLKMSTRFLDPRDYVNDPWVIIISLLSWCRDCVELTVEVTYAGDDLDRTAILREVGSRSNIDDLLTPAQKKIKQEIKDVFPKLEWMASLKKLALIKLGRFTTFPEDYFIVRSFLLEDLFDYWFFDKERERSSLECIWIQDFLSPTFYDSHLLNDAALKSYYVKSEEHDDDLNEVYSRFCNIEYLAGVDVTSPLAKLPNLKYFRNKYRFLHNDDIEERKIIDGFQENHQDLEFLFIELINSEYAPNLAYKMLKLKVLYLEQEIFNKKVVDSLVELYPNLEFLQFNNYCTKSEILEEEEEEERECLSAIRFRNLTSLHLHGSFVLDDGAFLLPIIEQCPKLVSLHMSGCLRPTSFLWNFDLFLQLAINLRDLRLTLDPEEDGITLFLLLKYLLCSSLQLERLVLIAKSPKIGPNWNHPLKLPDCIVNFALKMKRLVCCCIVYDRLDQNLIKEVQQRIAKEVVPIRPSFWFHLGREEPLASDPSVPSIHFHEMVEPTVYVPPPAF